MNRAHLIQHLPLGLQVTNMIVLNKRCSSMSRMHFDTFVTSLMATLLSLNPRMQSDVPGSPSLSTGVYSLCLTAFPHHLIKLTTGWCSADSSAPLFRLFKTCNHSSANTKSVIDLCWRCSGTRHTYKLPYARMWWLVIELQAGSSSQAPPSLD